jgi:hypothetical protein
VAVTRGAKLEIYAPYDVVVRGVDTIETDSSLLRDIDTARHKIDEGYLTSLRAFGVVMPLEFHLSEGMPHVVHGRRRTLGARIIWDEQEAAGVPEAQRIHLRGQLVRGDETFLFLRARVENSGRVDESPLTRGRNAQTALGRGCSEADVAAAFSVDVATLRGYLRLVESDERVQRAVESGKISASAAIQIAKLAYHQDQFDALTELVATGASEKAAKRLVNVRRGRGAGVSTSRRVLRELRETVAEPAEQAGDDMDPDYQRGFVSALSIVLGDGEIDPIARRWLETACARVLNKKKKKKKEKKA